MRGVLARPRRAANLFLLDTPAARTAVIGVVLALLAIVSFRYILTSGGTGRGDRYEHRNIEELTE